MTIAKPFIKWVGGKRQLLPQLEPLLPPALSRKWSGTYVEPFVGGGAMLFYILQNRPYIQHAVINDVNPFLSNCYTVVRDTPNELIELLREMQEQYLAIPTEEGRRELYLSVREKFNNKRVRGAEGAALFIFLNKTGFNGLYRVNQKGLFNVPFGRYKNPNICDAETIKADSQLLQKVEIRTGDYAQTLAHANEGAFFYLDPPYRPLSRTSNFNEYAKEPFDDDEQIRLKEFCDAVTAHDAFFLLSNSDPLNANPEDYFFDHLYKDYEIERVRASRAVNADPKKRGKISEITIRNYSVVQSPPLFKLSHSMPTVSQFQL